MPWVCAWASHGAAKPASSKPVVTTPAHLIISSVLHAVALSISQHARMIGGQSVLAVLLQILQQISQFRNGSHLQTQMVAHVLHRAVGHVLTVLGGHLL